MKVTHRASAPSPAPAVDPLASAALAAADKAPRLSCCCRLSELLPLVRQAHDAARDARLNSEQHEAAA